MQESNAIKEWTVAKEPATDPGERRAEAVASVALGLLTGIASAYDSRFDAVVRSRVDGSEVLRVPAPNEWFADELRFDLRRMTKARFVEKWRAQSLGDPHIPFPS
ncbi:hypothetical protein [Lacisediminihabitans changchengi]|uniref:Uncharacterized protein n=1 Tax=Lacisediminihabitans changchengi TaxID=2787634 RepID=A0A934SSP0_9MICO|nr:hypothetical protein [Lacisediminihabitans changchengi]MBK4348278.1 hypothetical protein [Lacisediminihabitans changchengi]